MPQIYGCNEIYAALQVDVTLWLMSAMAIPKISVETREAVLTNNNTGARGVQLITTKCAKSKPFNTSDIKQFSYLTKILQVQKASKNRHKKVSTKQELQ